MTTDKALDLRDRFMGLLLSISIEFREKRRSEESPKRFQLHHRHVDERSYKKKSHFANI